MDNILLNISLFSLVPFVFFILRWLYAPSIINPQKKLPPSPPKLPIIGHIHKLGLLPHRSLHSLSQKHGPIMLLHFGSKPVLVVSSDDGAREIMKTHDLVFANRPKSGVVKAILRGKKDIAFSDYDEYWRQMRSICVVQLLSNKMVESFRNIREEETSEMIEKIMQSSTYSSSPSPRMVNLSEMFVTLTNDVVFRATLGRKYSDGKIVEMILGFADLIGVFNIADYIPWLSWVNHFNGLNAKVDKVAKEFHEFMDTVFQDRHKSYKEGDASKQTTASNFLDILLQIRRDNTSSTQLLEDDAIKAIIIDMFAGGTDTTHTLMDWVMVELLRHPKTMQKLQTEVRKVVQGKLQVTEDDLQSMLYLKAVIKETLRLRCPVPLLVPHESAQDRKVMGYNISAGTQAIINGWAIGRNPESWLNPEEFQPERFLNSEIDFQGFHFQFIPFGAGRRGCPGTNFAIVLNELALAKLMHKFDFALPNGAKPEDMEMEERAGINIKRKAPLLVIASPNSS